ncbi:hypothetical protein H4R22_004716 [Coemansia sp. RSA 1290]|nr:hypothetical protein H4R22_004716 [Coemansia sp. RSA 1290]KAJ2645900.1 hypothetical protein IWW40_005799 [Coemansia sp. RSA 1250]
MKIAYCLSLLAAVGSAAPLARRGLLDLDLGLCLDLSLLGLVNIDINHEGCSAKYPHEEPLHGDHDVCDRIKTYKLNPSDINVHCVDVEHEHEGSGLLPLRGERSAGYNSGPHEHGPEHEEHGDYGHGPIIGGPGPEHGGYHANGPIIGGPGGYGNGPEHGEHGGPGGYGNGPEHGEHGGYHANGPIIGGPGRYGNGPEHGEHGGYGNGPIIGGPGGYGNGPEHGERGGPGGYGNGPEHGERRGYNAIPPPVIAPEHGYEAHPAPIVAPEHEHAGGYTAAKPPVY